MKHTVLLLISIGAIIFTSCKEDSIAMKDYYYPLEEIEEFVVYEYDRVDEFNIDDIDTTTLYYKIYNIEDQKFSVVSLNEQFYIRDSMVLSMGNNAIMMDEYHQITSRGLEASKSPGQMFYPSKMKIGDEHTYTLVFDEVEINRYHSTILTVTSKLIEKENDFVTFEDQMIFEQKGLKANDNSSNTSQYKIKFKEKIGLVDFISITGTVKTQFKLNKIWSPSEWKE